MVSLSAFLLLLDGQLSRYCLTGDPERLIFKTPAINRSMKTSSSVCREQAAGTSPKSAHGFDNFTKQLGFQTIKDLQMMVGDLPEWLMEEAIAKIYQHLAPGYC